MKEKFLKRQRPASLSFSNLGKSVGMEDPLLYEALSANELSAIPDSHIYLGRVSHLKNAFEQGIRWVLNVGGIAYASELSKYNKVVKEKEVERKVVDGVQFLYLPVEDSVDEKICEYFETANSFIDEARKANDNVFIHCREGKNRSPIIVAAWLVHSQGLSIDEALAKVKEGRPCAESNLAFHAQLDDYAKGLTGEPSAKKMVMQESIPRSTLFRQLSEPVTRSELEKAKGSVTFFTGPPKGGDSSVANKLRTTQNCYLPT